MKTILGSYWWQYLFCLQLPIKAKNRFQKEAPSPKLLSATIFLTASDASKLLFLISFSYFYHQASFKLSTWNFHHLFFLLNLTISKCKASLTHPPILVGVNVKNLTHQVEQVKYQYHISVLYISMVWWYGGGVVWCGGMVIWCGGGVVVWWWM